MTDLEPAKISTPALKRAILALPIIAPLARLSPRQTEDILATLERQLLEAPEQVAILSRMAAQFVHVGYISFHDIAKESKMSATAARQLLRRAQAEWIWHDYLREARANVTEGQSWGEAK